MTAPFPSVMALEVIELRRRVVGDIPDLRAAIEVSIAELSAFLRWAADGVPTLEALSADVAARDEAFEAGTGFEYVLRESGSGELIGQAGAGLRDDDSSALEIGYWVRSDRVGQGYATMAAGALTTMAFIALPAISRVEIRMDKGNLRSRRVPERLGFELIGEEVFDEECLPGQTGEGYIWVARREAWPRT